MIFRKKSDTRSPNTNKGKNVKKALPLVFTIVFFSIFGSAERFLFAQLPPTIHRIAPADSAVDMKDPPASFSVPSIDETHGLAFVPSVGGLKFPGSSEMEARPLRFEIMLRLDDAESYNVIAAYDVKSSKKHWELFTMPKDGRLTLYLPGNNPDHFRTGVGLVDGKWHKIALVLKAGTAELFHDGLSVGSMSIGRPVRFDPGHPVLSIGSLVEGGYRCDGALDDLRLYGEDDTLLLACDFEPVKRTEVVAGVTELSESMQALCQACSIESGVTAYSIEGIVGEHLGGMISLRSELIDRLFPTSGSDIEPKGRHDEKPTKNVPRLDGTSKDLRRVVTEFRLTTIDPDAFRPGVFAHWGEQYVDLKNQIEGKTPLPRGAAEQAYDRQALIHPGEVTPLQVVLRRTRARLDLYQARYPEAFVGPDTELSRLRNDWKKLADAVVKTSANAEPGTYFAACALRRRIFLADPALDPIDRILFLARACYAGSRLTNARNTDRMGGHFATQNYGFNTIRGGGIFTIDGWRGKNPKIKNLTQGRKVVPGAEGRLAGRELDYGSFHSPRLDYDGQTLYFAHNGSREHRWVWTPDTSWNLFKMKVDGDDIVQLTDGPYNDFDPCPLPDGRVAFISERRGGFIRCFGESAWLRVTTYVLHSMKNDGSDMIPISFFETSEWQPSVDNSGMLVYTRWDYTDRENCLGSQFWTCFPDGRNPRAPHGNYPLPWHTLDHNPLSKINGDQTPLREPDDYDKSKALTELVDDLSFLIGKKHGDHRFGRCPDAPSALPMTEMQIKAIPDSHRYVFTAAPHHGETFGSLCILDLRKKNDYHMNQVERITPYVPFPESESPGRGQYRYGSPWPLDEDTFLCNSWEDLVLLDRFGNEELICEREILPIGYDPRLRLTEPAPVRSRQAPPVIPRQTNQGIDFAGEDQGATVGGINVHVSDLPFPEDRPVKKLRVFQVILKPNPWMNLPDIGYAPENTPRIPLGTVPIEEDGSFNFEAPPNKQLIFQTLDENDMAVQTMRAVAFVHPGEQLVCTGCHEHPQETVPFRSTAKAFRRPPSKLRPEIGPIEPVSYYRTVKPVFEARCVGCHVEQGKGPQKMGFEDLRPYVFFYAGGMLGTTVRSGEAGGSRSIPGNVGAANSRLGRALFDENHRDAVSPEDKRRIVLWLDANAPRLGAFVDEDAQKRGELVWPVLDCERSDCNHGR